MVQQTQRTMKPGAETLGASAWTVIAIGWWAGLYDLTAPRLLLALGTLVVIPLGLSLVRWETSQAETLRRLAVRLVPLAGLTVAVTFPLAKGVGAAIAALPWLAACGIASLSALIELLHRRPRTVAELIPIVACAYLSVGAGWLLFSRYGYEPFDFPDHLTELTSVHFHFAGFAAAIVATRAVATLSRFAPAAARLSEIAGIGIIAAMPLVAAGITASQPLETASSGFLGLSLALLAGATLAGIRRPHVDPAARILLAVSSLSVGAAMALAVQWALANLYATSSLTLEQMARTHGVLNAAGFALCGLLGWRRAGGDAR